MKIMSEKTGKEYSCVEACLADEKKYDEELAAKKAAEEKALAVKKENEEKLAAERKADAEKVEAALQKVIEANKEYREAMNDFLRKHKSYHKSWYYTGEEALKHWNDLFDSFWF